MMIGSKLKVHHRCVDGRMLRDKRHVMRTIAAVYRTPNKVRDNVGDVWLVRRIANGMFMTVR